MLRKQKKNKLKTLKVFLKTKEVALITVTQAGTPTIITTTTTTTITQPKNSKTVHPPCETCGKTNHSTKKCYYEANAANRPPPAQKTQTTGSSPTKTQSKPFERNSSSKCPEFQLKKLRYQSGAAIDCPETTKLPSISQDMWQQT